MRRQFYILHGFLIAALLVVSALTGHARGQMPVAGEIVICHGSLTTTIRIDKDGQPTTAHHLCPDAVLALSAPFAGAIQAEFSATPGLFEFAGIAQIEPYSRFSGSRLARGPPV